MNAIAHRLAEIGDCFIGQHRSSAIAQSEEGFVVDAELVAGKLGLTPDAFWQEMKRGIIYGTVERGEGDDAGLARLTFRYRARSWSVTLEERRVVEPTG